MLQLYTSEEFALWFAAVDDRVAEVIATALDVVQELGPGRSAPGSTEWLLWYGVPEAPHFEHLAQWSAFRDEAKRALEHLASPRFLARFARLSAPEAAHVARAIEHIKTMAGVSRKGLISAMQGGPWVLRDRRSVMVSSYRAALMATGLDEADLPAHSDAVRELTLEVPRPTSEWAGLDPGHEAGAHEAGAHEAGAKVRLLYGVNASAGRALVMIGEHLDRHFYGDSVRRAERMWKQFLREEQPTGTRAMSPRER
jgi:hypothetical protein